MASKSSSSPITAPSAIEMMITSVFSPLRLPADADVEDAQCHALHYKGLKPPAKAVSGHVVGGVLGDGLYGKPNQRACDNGKRVDNGSG